MAAEAWPEHPAFRGDNEYLRRAVEHGCLEVFDSDFRHPPVAAWSVERMAAREDLVREFAWAIPNDDALDALERLAPIVEVGAGGGYWAHLLRERGADVVAYDPYPPPHPPDGPARRTFLSVTDRLWTEVRRGGPYRVRKHADRALFLCWPSLGRGWGAMALREYLRAGGDRVAFVGEPPGGCTGTEELYEMFPRFLTPAERVVIPSWFGIHDVMTVWRRYQWTSP